MANHAIIFDLQHKKAKRSQLRGIISLTSDALVQCFSVQTDKKHQTNIPTCTIYDFFAT